MAGTGVGKFSSTAGSNTANMTVNFAENMAPSNVNNAARELMGHMRDMYEQLGDGYFEFGDGDGTYTVARGDADTITITSAADISAVYFAGRKIRITDGGANVVEGTIASSSHSSTTQTVNLTGISLASGTPTKVELGIDTAAFGGRVILDDDEDSYLSASTDDQIDVVVSGTAQLEVKDGSIGPTTDSDVDLGTTAKRFKDAFVDTLTTTNNATVTGNLTVGGNISVTGTGLAEAAYPVGSIYMNINATDPNTLLGFGSWSRFGEGKMLISQLSSDEDFDTGEETGGAKTHTLTIAEMPAHDHPRGSNSNGAGFTDDAGTGGLQGYMGGDQTFGTFDARLASQGGGTAHNNMPPYIVVYMWKRAS